MQPHEPADIADLWRDMDRAWDALGLDNRNPDPARLAAFYHHPVWAQSGAFAETDPVSRGHREAIIAWMLDADTPTILDYGGGYGGLARMMAAAMPERSVNVYEPFPSPEALSRAAAFSNLRYIGKLEARYSCALCVDVLEHVPDPLAVLAEITAHLRPGGYLLDASNFYPLIRCHLPDTFYLRYSFPIFAQLLGLRRVGRVAGSHATAYQKVVDNAPRWGRLRAAEAIARAIYPALRQSHQIYRIARRRPADVSL
ncbi:methyltransferase domain-containing protein [Chloroflexales bacterium ZM16-3]|nr:methyltransferase domain-containing protein [Chloroflexales bacterium ZM16-3]